MRSVNQLSYEGVLYCAVLPFGLLVGGRMDYPSILPCRRNHEGTGSLRLTALDAVAPPVWALAPFADLLSFLPSLSRMHCMLRWTAPLRSPPSPRSTSPLPRTSLSAPSSTQPTVYAAVITIECDGMRLNSFHCRSHPSCKHVVLMRLTCKPRFTPIHSQ